MWKLTWRYWSSKIRGKPSNAVDSSFSTIGAMGACGSELILVSNIGDASGWDRRVIQKANGEDSWLKIRSDVPLKELTGGGGRSMTDCGIVYCLFAESKMLTCRLNKWVVWHVSEDRFSRGHKYIPGISFVCYLNSEVLYVSTKGITRWSYQTQMSCKTHLVFLEWIQFVSCKSPWEIYTTFWQYGHTQTAWYIVRMNDDAWWSLEGPLYNPQEWQPPLGEMVYHFLVHGRERRCSKISGVPRRRAASTFGWTIVFVYQLPLKAVLRTWCF